LIPLPCRRFGDELPDSIERLRLSTVIVEVHNRVQWRDI
jgi:hypothetical protein